jgi:hypothetical protein
MMNDDPDLMNNDTIALEVFNPTTTTTIPITTTIQQHQQQHQQQHNALSPTKDKTHVRRNSGISVTDVHTIIANGQVVVGADVVQLLRSVSRPYAFPIYHDYINLSAARAFVKKKVFVIRTTGKNGRNAGDGIKGRDGLNGKRGIDGSAGLNGGPGFHGTHGEDGHNAGDGEIGEDARPIYVKLSGTRPENVQLEGSYNGILNLGLDPESILLLDARGGIGGDGGRGGAGGNGGNGGDGGCGGNGVRGSNGSTNQSGARGGNGGNAGCGGSGGSGGHGGDGGSPGFGGRGGEVVLQSSNPQLFILVEALVTGGSPGKPGIPGIGGQGGRGGYPGAPGRGGKGGSAGSRLGEQTPKPSRGLDGSEGFSGSPGFSGLDGKDGRSGKPLTENGENGSILYSVLDPRSGHIIESSTYKYNIKVLGFELFGVTDDGVFEPDEQVVLKDVVIMNDGGLTLPEGSYLKINETTTFQPAEPYIPIPSIKPGASVKLNNIYGYIGSAPNASRSEFYQSESTLSIHAELLGRHFDDSVYSRTVPIHFPVHVAKVNYPTQLAREQQGSFSVDFLNLSTLPYGNQSEYGSLEYRIIVDPRLKIVSEASQHVIEGSIDYLNPGNNYSHQFDAVMDSDTDYFERLDVRIELLLRGKLIEIQERQVRCCPTFIPMLDDDSSKEMFDVLFVTNRHITRLEYQLYERALRLLGLRFNVWDIEHYNGLSYEEKMNVRHSITWVNQFQGKLILMPMSQTDDEIWHISPQDIFSHFQSDLVHVASPDDGSDTTSSADSGIVLIGGNPSRMLSYLFSGCPETEIPKKDLIGTFLVKTPTNNHLEQYVEKYMSNIQNMHPSMHFKMAKQLFQPEKQALGKYCVGTATYQQLPLSAIDRLFVVEKSGDLYASIDSGYNYVISNKFYRDSNFVRMLSVIINALSIEQKMKLLQVQSAIDRTCEIIDSQNNVIGINDLILFGLYYDIKTELVYPDHENNTRFKKVVSILQDNITQYHHDPKIIYILWSVVCRISKETFWTGLNVFTKEGKKKRDFNTLKQQLKTILLEQMPHEKSVIQNEMNMAKRDIKNPPIPLIVVRPLVTKDQLQQFERA